MPKRRRRRPSRKRRTRRESKRRRKRRRPGRCAPDPARHAARRLERSEAVWSPGVSWIEIELVLVSLAAMLSPTTLSFSILVLVVSDRPFRTGCWFYLGAFGATIGIGVLAAFVLGDAAASSHPSSPKTWVAILDLIAGALLLVWVSRVMRRPRDPARAASMIERIRKITASPAIAVAGAGATLANPGGFIPLA